MDTDRKLIVYPIYFAADKSIADGRRVPSALASSSPTSSLIHAAATRLGLKAVIENKSHPKDILGSKRVAISTNDKKNAVLLLLVQELAKLTSVPAPSASKKNRK